MMAGKLTRVSLVLWAATVIATAQTPGAQADANESLFEAARAGDTARIAAALDRGANVNAKSRYEVTALIFAAGNGRLDAVKLLVARGADVNAQDTFYRMRAADMAITNGHVDVAVFLLQNGSAGGSTVLLSAVQSNNTSLLRAVLGTKLTRQDLQSAVAMAERLKRDALMPVLKTALEALPAEPAATAFSVDPSTLPRYAGTYRDSAGGFTMTVDGPGRRADGAAARTAGHPAHANSRKRLPRARGRTRR